MLAKEYLRSEVLAGQRLKDAQEKLAQEFLGTTLEFTINPGFGVGWG